MAGTADVATRSVTTDVEAATEYFRWDGGIDSTAVAADPSGSSEVATATAGASSAAASARSSAAACRCRVITLLGLVREVRAPDATASGDLAPERLVDDGSVEVAACSVAPALCADGSREGWDESCSADRLVEPAPSEEFVSAAATPCPAPSAMHAPAPMAANQYTQRLVVTAGL